MKSLLYIGNSSEKSSLTPGGIDTLGKQLSDAGFIVIKAGLSKHKFSRLFEMIYKTISNRKKIDFILIDTYSTSAFWFAFIIGSLAKFLHVKYIPILRGGGMSSRLKKSQRFCQYLFRNAYINVAVSNFLKVALSKITNNVVVIPNNIPVKEYPFLERNPIGPKLLWVRSFHKIYNPNMAGDVLSLLLKEYPNAVLCMVGPDKDGSMEKFKAYCEKLGVIHNVTITGLLSKPEWIRLSKSYDIFINTTNVDNTPVSVIEAMALGLPVVSTNVGGIPYLLENNTDAILVQKADAIGMHAAVNSLIDNPMLSMQLATNARKKAESFNWDVVSKLWLDLLK